jgi:hypothetical protein
MSQVFVEKTLKIKGGEFDSPPKISYDIVCVSTELTDLIADAY